MPSQLPMKKQECGMVEDLVAFIAPGSRLRHGLELLQRCLAGSLPELVSQLSLLERGETRRIPVNGDALYLLLQCYITKSRPEGRFEAHARHADLQFVWSGRECIEVSDQRRFRPLPARDEQGNLYFPMGAEVHSRLLLEAGDVAVFSPQDAHAPCLSSGDGEGSLVRKIVVKVRDAHLRDGPVPEEGPR
jgi:biofilm protein TabA